MQEAKIHLSGLIQKALEGEEIIIAKGKQPLVKLVAIPELRKERRLGGAKEFVKFIADDFDAPLEEFKE